MLSVFLFRNNLIWDQKEWHLYFLHLHSFITLINWRIILFHFSSYILEFAKQNHFSHWDKEPSSFSSNVVVEIHLHLELFYGKGSCLRSAPISNNQCIFTNPSKTRVAQFLQKFEMHSKMKITNAIMSLE